jgi:NADPH:quinone reductase-like Zn-dependent oxidoreductase
MRVAEVQGSFGVENLIVTRRDPPRIRGARDVLLRMHAASLNARDLLTIRGIYNPRQPLPLIPCSDGAGTVIAVGDRVTRVKPGDRVTPTFAQGWLDGPLSSRFKDITLGGPLDGTLAEMMCLHENGVVAAPAHLTYEEASTLPCAGLTAWNAVVEQGCVRSGQTVVIQGTGGVALFALQFAQQAGARSIVLSKDDAKLERCRSLGADYLINYLQTPEWGRAVKEITGGAGADFILDLGGEATLHQSIRAVRASGTIALVGVLGGAEARLQLPLVVMRNVRLQGVTVGSRAQHERMAESMAETGLKPVLDSVFAFAEVRDACARIASGRHFGKVCLRHGDSEQKGPISTPDRTF